MKRDSGMSKRMRNDNLIDLVEVRSRRTMVRISNSLLPGESTVENAEELANRVARQFEALPDSENGLLRRRVALAIHDLESLISALQADLDNLGQELKAVNQHSGAVKAYNRATRLYRDGSV